MPNLSVGTPASPPFQTSPASSCSSCSGLKGLWLLPPPFHPFIEPGRVPVYLFLSPSHEFLSLLHEFTYCNPDLPSDRQHCMLPLLVVPGDALCFFHSLDSVSFGSHSGSFISLLGALSLRSSSLLSSTAHLLAPLLSRAGVSLVCLSLVVLLSLLLDSGSSGFLSSVIRPVRSQCSVSTVVSLASLLVLEPLVCFVDLKRKRGMRKGVLEGLGCGACVDSPCETRQHRWIGQAPTCQDDSF